MAVVMKQITRVKDSINVFPYCELDSTFETWNTFGCFDSKIQVNNSNSQSITISSGAGCEFPCRRSA